MKKLMMLFIVVVLYACSEDIERRTLEDARLYAENYAGFDTLHFVVEANCDYQYFFEYQPMRNGGFYAYGTYQDQPHLLIIPKYASDEVREAEWPIHYTVAEAVELLNVAYGETLLDEKEMYQSVFLELNTNVLKDHSDAHMDMAFFILIPVDDTHYIAFQRDDDLVIYHEDDGFFTSSHLYN